MLKFDIVRDLRPAADCQWFVLRYVLLISNYLFTKVKINVVYKGFDCWLSIRVLIVG